MGVQKVAAGILAGGKSSRMGTNKAFLPFQGKPLIYRVYMTLAGVFDEVFVVGSREAGEYLGIASYPDLGPDERPSSIKGIFSGLAASPTLYTFFAPCDMPFLDEKALEEMRRSLPEGCDVYVPYDGKYWQPLHAIYSKNCLPAIEAQFANTVYKIMALYDRVNTCTVDMEALEGLAPYLPLFFNINTAADLKAAEGIAVRLHGRKEVSFDPKR